MPPKKKSFSAGSDMVPAAEPAIAAEEVPAPVSPCLVVGIGASAGGQEALEQLFTDMPPDCGLSFVVVMHLPPAGPSFLAEMLGRITTMMVVTAEEGMPLKPDTVHVIPAGRELTVSGGLLRLGEPALSGARHPIDSLFRSLAAELKERAIAVVLSGSGVDGAEGVKGVRSAGGTVIVQEPGSAIYPSMPRSAIAAGADFILPAVEIPAKIAEIAGGRCPLPSRECRVATHDEELRAVFDIVKVQTGHDFSSYKVNTVMRRIERRMAVNDVAGIKKYVAILNENSQEAHALCQDILIGVTSFFRDPEAFETLRRVVIPRLFANRGPDEPVRIWHTCCATGEEVYSMAFLVREYLDKEGINANVQFFATDIDEVAIAQARTGLYPDDIEAELGAERLKTFFTRSDNRWQVAKRVREMIVFAHHSLIKNPPFSKLDLLVCRNFLIYLNPDMQKRLIALFHQVLKPGGFLFLGSSETVGRQSDLFTPVDKKWKIFQRLESVRRAEALFPFTTPVRYYPGTGRSFRPAAAFEPSPGAVAEKLLVERYSPPCVVVNEKYEVVYVSTRTSRYLEVPVGEPTRDILRMAKTELRPALRAAIYKAFSEQKEVVFRGVKVAVDGGDALVNVLVEPVTAPPPAERLAMVVFEPALPPAVYPAPVGNGGDASAGDESSREMLVRQLEEQLRVTHEQLQAVTEQLETSNEGFLSANEELISMNEEFQSGNEELQSTNEELETSKEELQALNEELVTVNAELQGKVEELNQANNDMENLLESSGIATLFLDRRLTIKRFTPAMAAILNLIPADVGRPFRHLAGTIDWPGLARDAEEVLEKLLPIEREVAAVEGGQCFIMRVLPYRTTGGAVEGIVVTLIDISERKRMEERTAHLASFPQLNPNPVLEVDSSGNFTYFNPATEKVLEGLGKQGADAALFLPADMDGILESWDRINEATLYREIVIKERVFGETIFLTPRFDVVRIYAYDMTERKRTEGEREATVEFLRFTNESRGTEELIHAATTFFQKRSGCEAVGIRVREGEDYPYYESRGFPEEFVFAENRLCACDETGRPICDSAGNPVIDCMCGNVICGRFDPSKSFFTAKGSFWSNCTTELLASTSEADRQARTRNRCNGEGYESVALIPLRLGEERMGLLQLNDRQKGRFSPETIALWERLADYLAVALAKFRTDEALRKSEERFRLLIEGVSDYAIFMLDLEGRVMSWNSGAERIKGYRQEEILGRHFSCFYPPDAAAEGLPEQELRIAARDGRFEDEGWRVRKDGSRFWANVTITAIRDENGRITGFSKITRDLTERKRAEEELQKAHGELELRVRERTEELATAVETLLGEITVRERAEISLQRLNRLYTVLSETDKAIVRAGDRDSLFNDFCRIAVEHGGFLLSWVGLVDEESNQLRRVAASGATDYLDDIRITIDAEPAGEGPTGISVRQGTYFICNDFQNDPCTRPWHERGKAHGVHASASIALKQEGRVVGALTLYADTKDFFDKQQEELLLQIGTDISFALDNLEQEARRRRAEQALQEETLERLRAVEELRKKEQLLIQQNRLAAMGEMIGNIAHQWRQPLNTLGLIIQELPMSYDAGMLTREDLEASVSKAKQVINHMSHTIDDFRNFFRPDKEKVLFKANDIVANTVSLIDGSLREQRIKIEISAEEAIFIHGYPNEYSQVILNILINARDAFAERKADEPRIILVTLSREDDKAVATITDNAGGIAAEIMEKIFEPYFTTKGPDKGTGVGLFMSKTIIEKNMGGRLSACNSGNGTEFRIEV